MILELCLTRVSRPLVENPSTFRYLSIDSQGPSSKHCNLNDLLVPKFVELVETSKRTPMSPRPSHPVPDPSTSSGSSPLSLSEGDHNESRIFLSLIP